MNQKPIYTLLLSMVFSLILSTQTLKTARNASYVQSGFGDAQLLSFIQSGIADFGVKGEIQPAPSPAAPLRRVQEMRGVGSWNAVIERAKKANFIPVPLPTIFVEKFGFKPERGVSYFRVCHRELMVQFDESRSPFQIVLGRRWRNGGKKVGHYYFTTPTGEPIKAARIVPVDVYTDMEKDDQEFMAEREFWTTNIMRLTNGTNGGQTCSDSQI